jgi:tetratricopeptide (TPR) repeat protein
MTKAEIDMQEVSIIDNLKAELERNPTNVKKYLRLGWAYYGENKLDEAIETLQDAKHRFPDDIEVLYALALAHKKAGDSEEALANFREVVKSVEHLDDQTRGAMLKRLAKGHINILERGDWDLKNEIWERR